MQMQKNCTFVKDGNKDFGREELNKFSKKVGIESLVFFFDAFLNELAWQLLVEGFDFTFVRVPTDFWTLMI